MLFIRLSMSPRGAALGLLRWLVCALLPVWLCLGSSVAAAASTDADEGAPMCDPHAASVAATPEVPEIDHGKLEQLPCDEAWRLWLGSKLDDGGGHAAGRDAARDGVPSSPPPELQHARVRMDALVPLVIVMPERAQPVRMPRSHITGLPPRHGHPLSIYRPPVRGR